MSAFVRSSGGMAGRRLGARNTFAGKSLPQVAGVAPSASAVGVAVVVTGGSSASATPAFCELVEGLGCFEARVE